MNECTDYAIGVDIGGTKIAAGIVSADGQILARDVIPTPAREGGAAVLDAVAAVVRSVLSRYRADPSSACGGKTNTGQSERELAGHGVLGIGLGSAGVIDSTSCTVVSATDAIVGWAGIDLRSGLRERLAGTGPWSSLRVEAVNDVHAHALGESLFGAGRGQPTMLLAAFGTGVGGAYVIEGSAQTGAHGVAGHIGHIPSEAARDLPCSCGAQGHLEAIASGPGLHALYRHRGGPSSVEDTRAVFALAAQGDATALSAIRDSAAAAGSGLAGLVNSLDPHCVIVSGGLAEAGSLWWNPLLQAFEAGLVPALRNNSLNTGASRFLTLQAAHLGTEGALLGAASLVLPSRP